VFPHRILPRWPCFIRKIFPFFFFTGFFSPCLVKACFWTKSFSNSAFDTATSRSQESPCFLAFSGQITTILLQQTLHASVHPFLTFSHSLRTVPVPLFFYRFVIFPSRTVFSMLMFCRASIFPWGAPLGPVCELPKSFRFRLFFFFPSVDSDQVSPGCFLRFRYPVEGDPPHSSGLLRPSPLSPSFTDILLTNPRFPNSPPRTPDPSFPDVTQHLFFFWFPSPCRIACCYKTPVHLNKGHRVLIVGYFSYNGLCPRFFSQVCQWLPPGTWEVGSRRQGFSPGLFPLCL